MTAPHETRPKHTIPAVTKAMELLRILTEPGRETTTKALALRLKIPRTSCYRILRSLMAADWVRPVDGARHELSLGLLPVLTALEPVAVLAAAVKPALATVAARTGLTSKVSVRRGDHAVTVARVESPQQTSIAVRLGASFHLAYGSSGSVLLSDAGREEVDRIVSDAPRECWEHQQKTDVQKRLRELHRNGWCADLGTYRASCHAISAPLRDARGKVVAAITIIGFPHELPRTRLADMARVLLEGAAEAERQLRNLNVDGFARGGNPS